MFSGLLALGFAGIYALGDVQTLAGDGVENENSIGMENIVVMRVADLADGLAGDSIVVQFGFGSDLTANDHQVALGVSLASHAAIRVLREAGVQDGIGNGIANFVRMALTDRLGRKDVVFAHAIRRY